MVQCTTTKARIRANLKASLDRAHWRPVVFAADCGEDGLCPVCSAFGMAIDFGDCPCPGSSQEDELGRPYEYREFDGVLMARPRKHDPAPADEGHGVDGGGGGRSN